MSKSEKSKKRGRPPVENPATARLPVVQVTPEQLAQYRETAKSLNKTFSQWVRDCLDKSVKKKK